MTDAAMTAMNAVAAVKDRLTRAQQAALARIAYCLERPRSVALLCGPAGVGKTLVLETAAGSRQLVPKAAVRWSFGDVEPCLAAASGLTVPQALLIDDAHLARDGELAPLIERYFQRQPAGSLALAGEGRLLSLVARDSRVEQAVSLRATLPPFTLDESQMFLTGKLSAAGAIKELDGVARTIHEIAAGIPAAVARLADLAAVLSQANPGRPLVPDDIETIHRRLSLQAA